MKQVIELNSGNHSNFEENKTEQDFNDSNNQVENVDNQINIIYKEIEALEEAISEGKKGYFIRKDGNSSIHSGISTFCIALLIFYIKETKIKIIININLEEQKQ